MEAMRGFFDPTWYLEQNPDVRDAGLDPLRHFVTHGLEERRDPNRWFDSNWYLQVYPDVAAAGMHPLLHYLQAGAAELRNPHPRFDAPWYADRHPEAASNPLLYHMRLGIGLDYHTEPTVEIRDYLPSTESAPKIPRDVIADVVVPVYRGLDETRRCIESVLADPDRPAGSRLIVIDDRSPERALSAWLDRQAAAGRIVLYRNRRNLGFVASVNRGMVAAEDRDVVLLNSDTEVPAGWLTRLTAQAYSRPRIASVSPFSNNATICSYPVDRGGALPFGMTLEQIDEVCRTANAGRSVKVPTTVGFCMYIRRDALNQVGLFDEQTFGRGYGEENDFCVRASRLGWQHILACDSFVYHKGSVSFGPDMGPLAKQGFDILNARYPGFDHLISRHVRLDEVGPYRFATTAELFRRSGRPTILLVSHSLGGGVKRHIDLLIERSAGKANFLLLSATTRGAALTAPAIEGHPDLILSADRMDELLQVLRHIGVSRVHIHHLAGMDMDIRTLIHRLGVPFDVSIHDYYAICPQVNLLPWPEGRFCDEPAPATCNACIANRASHGATDILSWRRRHSWMLVGADRVLCPTADVRDRLARYNLAARAVVAPHEPVSPGRWEVMVRRRPGRRLRIAVLGVLADHKGAHVVAALAEAASRADLEIRLIGYTEPGFPDASRALVHETGEYKEEDLPKLLKQIQPDVVWYPAPWPETHSYTLSAALAAELPVVATRIGAFPERLVGRPLTWLVEPTLATEDWITTFAAVRTALTKAAGRTLRGNRTPVADFYDSDYLAPATLPLPTPATGSSLTDLRRNGRTSIVVIPERFDTGAISPCAYIRLLQPLDHPDVADDMDIVLADAESALQYRADLFITQRYAIDDLAAATTLIEHVKQVGGALVYDMDDDLLNIPRGHANAAELRPKARVVQRLVQSADHVWVSTPGLAASVKAQGTTALIVPNGLDERLWADGVQRAHPRLGPVRILCMGTATHDDDFAIIAPALERLKQDFGYRVEIDMIGVTTRAAVPDCINRVGVSPHGTLSYPGFVNWITQMPAWDIGLAPLADTPFNRCKSSIKTLDYAAIGLAVLASDMPVYRGSLADGPGGMLVENDPGAWYAALSRLVRDPMTLASFRSGAQRAFLATGTIASQAATRRQALLALVRPAPSRKPVRRTPTKRSRR
ncbi:MAG: glycosyltransferase [Acetobacteraceae bacterium]